MYVQKGCQCHAYHACCVCFFPLHLRVHDAWHPAIESTQAGYLPEDREVLQLREDGACWNCTSAVVVSGISGSLRTSDCSAEKMKTADTTWLAKPMHLLRDPLLSDHKYLKILLKLGSDLAFENGNGIQKVESQQQY